MNKWSALRPYLFFVVLALAVGGAAGAAARAGMEAYDLLTKPPATPPDRLFPVVWTLLYLLMAWAFFRILRSPPGDERRGAIVLFLVQIALNAAWSVVFFGLHSPAGGLFVILLLDAAIVATIAAVLAVDQVAGWLLAPYLVWVAFATVLNGSIWWLN